VVDEALPYTHGQSPAVVSELEFFLSQERHERHQRALKLRSLICMKVGIGDGVKDVSDNAPDEM
jgi:hypothetical protein